MVSLLKCVLIPKVYVDWFWELPIRVYISIISKYIDQFIYILEDYDVYPMIRVKSCYKRATKRFDIGLQRIKLVLMCYNLYEPKVFRDNRLKFVPVSLNSSLGQHEPCQNRRTNIW